MWLPQWEQALGVAGSWRLTNVNNAQGRLLAWQMSNNLVLDPQHFCFWQTNHTVKTAHHRGKILHHREAAVSVKKPTTWNWTKSVLSTCFWTGKSKADKSDVNQVYKSNNTTSKKIVFAEEWATKLMDVFKNTNRERQRQSLDFPLNLWWRQNNRALLTKLSHLQSLSAS